jgi:hypothetical protein
MKNGMCPYLREGLDMPTKISLEEAKERALEFMRKGYH